MTGVPVAEAADWCRVGSALARLILETLAEISSRSTVEQLAAREQFLVTEAAIVGVEGVRRLCQRALEQVDPDGAEPREEEIRAKAGARIIRPD